MFQNIRLNHYKILEYVVTFLIILNCNSIFLIHSLSFEFLINFSFQFFFIILILCKLVNRKYSFTNQNCKNLSLIFMILLFIYSFFLLVVNLSLHNVSLILIDLFLDSILFVIFFLYTNGNHIIDESIFKCFENIIVFLAICSLVLWVLSSLHIVQPNTYISLSSSLGDRHYTNGYFYLLFTPQQGRNTGIFIEGPIYSYVLSIALFIELFIRDSTNKIFTWKSLILLCTIISTMSTTGLMISIPLIIIKLLTSSLDLFNKIIIIILLPIFAYLLKFILFNKFITSSYNIRSNDITSCISAWKQHFVLGNGLGNLGSIQQYMYNFRLLPGGNAGLSTGLFSVLALGGIVYASFYIIPTILSFVMCPIKVKILSIVSLLLFIYTYISNSYIYIMIISYFVSYIILISSNTKSIQ